jgi:hypothetical protein
MLKTYDLLLHRLSFAFSEGKSLEITKERAKWASKFIQIICDAPRSKKLNEPSLRDLLISCKISGPQTKEVE